MTFGDAHKLRQALYAHATKNTTDLKFNVMHTFFSPIIQLLKSIFTMIFSSVIVISGVVNFCFAFSIWG